MVRQIHRHTDEIPNAQVKIKTSFTWSINLKRVTYINYEAIPDV